MRHTIEQIKNNIESKTGGRALSNIGNLYANLQEVFFDMMSNVSLPSAIRRVPLIAPLASKPYLRLIPYDCGLESIIDIRKRDYLNGYSAKNTGVYGSEFMRMQCEGMLDIEHIDGLQYINFNRGYKDVVVIDNCEDPTNGDWSLIGSAFGLEYDKLYVDTGEASISFRVNATTLSYGVSKQNFKDIVNIKDKKYITLNIFSPIELPNGIKIQFGRDNLNYKEIVITRDYENKRVGKGNNFISIDISLATVIGSYDPINTLSDDDIKYFSIVFSEPVTNLTESFKIDSIIAIDDLDWDIEYYSNSIVIDQYGKRRTNCVIDSLSDYVLLNEKEYILFLRAFSVISGIDIRPASANSEVNVYGSKLDKLYENFNFNYPSRKILMSTNY